MEEITGKVILFDRKTAPYAWSPNEVYAQCYFKSIENYLNDLLKCKGYLSYETLADNIGIGATADEIDAMKVLRDNGRGIHFELAKLDSDELAYEIKICEGSRNNS